MTEDRHPPPPGPEPRPPPLRPSRAEEPVLARSGSLRARMGSLPEIGGWTQKLCAAAGFDARTGSQVELAVEEAATNIITYALEEDSEARFHLSAWAWPGCVEVVLVDDGPPFDPTAVPPPVLDGSLEERPVGGLGIHLIRSFLDAVVWRREGNWNVLVLRREPGESSPP